MAVNQLVQHVYSSTEVPPTKIERAYQSIGYELADKFSAKYKQRIKKADLFDVKVRNKITLKYHEAWALQNILTDLIPLTDSDFKTNIIQTLINTLDQKTV